MTLYYQDDWVTLWHADNREILPTLADQSVDLVPTDPPYSETTHMGARSHPERTSTGKWRSGGNEPQMLIDFAHIPTIDLQATLSDLSRIANAWIVSFMDWRHIAQIEIAPPPELRFVRFGMWHKTNGAPQFTGDRPAAGWEGIAILHRTGGRMQWNGGGRNAVFTYPKINGSHPTQKPIPLICELVALFSNPGDLILDPFAGSGTTGVAAKRLGRRCILIEQEERYCEIAAKRLSQDCMNLEIA